MSRSNPTEHAVHPAQRWFEWDGSKGGIRYYDKATNANINIGKNFTFIVLDRLAVVKGWHEPSESGITSNEVRDTKSERMVVKAFKGGILAEGFYASIRDRIKAVGGHFTCNLYIAWKDADGLKIGSFQFKGAALNAWVEFEKANREGVWKKAVTIDGMVKGKKGKIEFVTPTFKLTDIAEKTDTEAKALDQLLQVYLKNYFQRTRLEQVEKPAAPVGEAPATEGQPPEEYVPEAPEPGEDVPF